MASRYVTFAGRFRAFFLGAGVASEVVAAGARVAAGVSEAEAGLDTLTSAGFGDCFEHALIASSNPRMPKPAIMASFCWRDQDESMVSEIVLFVVGVADF